MSEGNLRTTTTEGDAKLGSIGEPWGSGFRGKSIVREWTEIDPTVADTLATTMRSVATVTNPLVDGEQETGVFANSDVRRLPHPGDVRWVII